MRASTIISSIAVLATGVLATPTASYGPPSCMSAQTASTLANNFGKLISAYSAKLANQTLAVDFTDYSESVNSLIDNGGTAPQALLGATFTNRSAFEAGQSGQAPVPFTVKQVWNTCGRS
jgi:hypothetical protein